MCRFRKLRLLIFSLTLILGCFSVACGSAETQQVLTGLEGTRACSTDEMNISSLKGYLGDYGYWHFTGLLSNNSSSNLTDLEILIEITDEAGTVLKKEVVSPMMAELVAGESTPFELWVYEALPTLDHYTAQVISCQASESQRATVEIESVTRVVDRFNITHLTGEVTNNGTQPVVIENLAAALYNEAGELVTAAPAKVFMHYLEAGKSGPFRIELHAPADLLASLGEYKFFANAVITNPAAIFDLAVNDFNSYIDIADSFHLFGLVSNNSDKLLNVELVAGIYDEAGNVLDAASMSLPVTTIAPGESIPLDFDNWGPMSHTAEGFDKAKEYSVDIDYAATRPATSSMVTLTTQEDTNSYVTGQARFFGQVVNNTGNRLSGAVVIVILYERGSNHLLATGYTWILDEISKGKEVPYIINVDVPTGFDTTNMEYELIVRGKLP